MLTREHVIVVYDGARAIPDRLTQRAHGHYRAYAERMLAAYGTGVGQMRRDLHRRVHAVLAEEPDCPARRIDAFCKLLDDAGRYATDRRGRAADLRMRVFSLAAEHFPLVEQADGLFETDVRKARARIADTLGRSWDQIEADLYADVMAFQRLEAFDGYADADALLARYNVAQIQACLYQADRMTVHATDDFKTILRYAKLARLLHEIRRLGPSRYELRLTGPGSVLRQTRRYGVNLARFLPALVACRGWRAEALLRTPWGGKARLQLDSRDGLRSHLPAPADFDSSVEEGFAAKFGAERDGWVLQREGGILHEGQTAFVPDFLFRHADGTEVLLEIVGFWTPEYLQHKRVTLRRFRRHRILLAVCQGVLREGTRIPEDVIPYKTALKLKPVLEALERVRHDAGP